MWFPIQKRTYKQQRKFISRNFLATRGFHLTAYASSSPCTVTSVLVMSLWLSDLARPLSRALSPTLGRDLLGRQGPSFTAASLAPSYMYDTWESRCTYAEWQEDHTIRRESGRWWALLYVMVPRRRQTLRCPGSGVSSRPWRGSGNRPALSSWHSPSTSSGVPRLITPLTFRNIPLACPSGSVNGKPLSTLSRVALLLVLEV